MRVRINNKNNFSCSKWQTLMPTTSASEAKVKKNKIANIIDDRQYEKETNTIMEKECRTEKKRRPAVLISDCGLFRCAVMKKKKQFDSHFKYCRTNNRQSRNYE